MVETLRHRRTKEAATDMFSLQPPRHIPTLPNPVAKLRDERRQEQLRKRTPRLAVVASELGHELPLAPQKRLADLRLKARHAGQTAIGCARNSSEGADATAGVHCGTWWRG